MQWGVLDSTGWISSKKDLGSRKRLWSLEAGAGTGHWWRGALLLEGKTFLKCSQTADIACDLSFSFRASVYTNSDQVANSSPLLSAIVCRTENTCSGNGLINQRLVHTAWARGHTCGRDPAALSVSGCKFLLLALVHVHCWWGLIREHESECPCWAGDRLFHPKLLLCAPTSLKANVSNAGERTGGTKWAWHDPCL